MDMTSPNYSLHRLTQLADQLRQVRKSDLHAGDWVIVKTEHSTYRVHVLKNGKYRVSGGWFDRKFTVPVEIGIVGCTWGGSAVKIDIVAACGLRLEFGNKVKTSAIREITVFRNSILN
ncbi:MAG: hypothetical protein WD182_04985 [Bacteroidota bacterium]